MSEYQPNLRTNVTSWLTTDWDTIPWVSGEITQLNGYILFRLPTGAVHAIAQAPVFSNPPREAEE